MRFHRPIVSLAAVLAASGALAASPCLEPGAGAVTVTGTLVQKVVPNPMDGRGAGTGDAGTVRWFVRLEASMCVAADSAAAEAAEVKDIRVVELIVPRKTMEAYTQLVGRRVSATGFVSTRQQEHAPAVVLLDVKTLDERPR